MWLNVNVGRTTDGRTKHGVFCLLAKAVNLLLQVPTDELAKLGYFSPVHLISSYLENRGFVPQLKSKSSNAN